MEQVIIGGYGDYLHNVNTEYNYVEGGAAWGGVEAFRKQQLVSTPGKFKRLLVKLNAAPGVGNSFVFTLRINEGPTLLTLTISDAETQDSNLVNEVVTAAFDRVSIECNPGGAPAADTFLARWTVMFEGDNAGESLLLAGSDYLIHTATTKYNVCAGYGVSWAVNEAWTHQIVPTDGKLKRLHVHLEGAPGAGTHYDFTLRVNGAPTALTCEIADLAVLGSDVVNEIVVAAGQRISIEADPTDGPTGRRVIWGFTFEADTDGESLVLNVSVGGTDNANDTFNFVSAGKDIMWNVLEWPFIQLAQECVIRNLYVWLSGAPGVGTNYIFTLRLNAGDTLLAVTIAGAATTGNDVADDIVIIDFDDVDIESDPFNAPAAGLDVAWSMVAFRQPPAVPVGGVSILSAAEVILEI